MHRLHSVGRHLGLHSWSNSECKFHFVAFDRDSNPSTLVQTLAKDHSVDDQIVEPWST